MSTFLRHEACPNCKSSDALAVFDDGHSYCFSCHWYESGDQSIADTRKKYDTRDPQVGDTFLPQDFDFNIPQQGIDWLRKYGILQKEIINNRFGWSNDGIILKNKNIRVAPLLVFPIYDEVGHLLMWQGRNFGDKGGKYITRGGKDVLHILGEQHQSDTIILTEDLLSAIKISRIAPSMPIWGSYMSLELARRLSTRFKKAVLWLDKDKAQEAVKQAANASHIFEKGCSCIRTERDPKEYTTEEINIYATD